MAGGCRQERQRASDTHHHGAAFPDAFSALRRNGRRNPKPASANRTGEEMLDPTMPAAGHAEEALFRAFDHKGIGETYR
jgi:hypothetical protein